MNAAISTLPAVPASTPGNAQGTPPGDAPESSTGRAFRALLGRQACARAETRADAGPDAEAAAKPAPAEPGAEEGAAATESEDAAPAEPTQTPIDPVLQHLLQPGAALREKAAGNAGAAGGREAGSSQAAASDLAAAAGSHRPGGPAGRAVQRPGIAGRDDAAAAPGSDSASPARAAGTDTAGFAGRLAEARGAADVATLRVDAPAVQATTSALPAPGAAQAEAAAAPSAQAALHAAPDSAEFPGEFGLQIATFARDGIEHAELHLNPADMGPVAVQIALDGTQAHVELRADMAATRDALQHSLPALAAALREAGLTLAGGSVSSHAGGQGSGQGRGGAEGDAGGPNAGRGPSSAAVLPAAVRRASRLGGVDLYA